MTDTKITAEFFTPDNNIGIEGTITPLSVEQYPIFVSKNILKNKLRLVANCIAPTLRKQYDWDKKIETALEEILGYKYHYLTSDTIKYLRNKSEHAELSPIEKLIERTLWLTAYDGVDPTAVSNINLIKMFKGLHIDEPSIQPELRWGGGTNHLSMRIYLGPEKFVRIHIYPEGDTPDKVNCIDLAHEHDGASAGIILTGQLVNQHYDLKNIGNEGSSPLYVLKNSDHHSNLGQAGRVNRVFEKIGSTNPKRISSKVYGPGEMYFFNGSPVRDTQRFSLPKTTLESDFHTSHNVATKGFTVTFFTNHTPEKAPDTYALLPPNTPDIFEATYNNEKRTIPADKAQEIVAMACKEVEAELNKRSSEYPTTFLDRGDPESVRIIRERFNTLKSGKIPIIKP